MEVIRRLEDLNPGPPSVVTVGVFDGVHLGHQEIMRIVRATASERGARSVVVTFDRNPEELVHPAEAVPYITTLRRKLKLIGEQGIDLAVVLPVERPFLDMPPGEFVSSVLHEKLAAVDVVVGQDFAFGKARAGNVGLLRELGEKFEFRVTAVPPVSVGEAQVSSTAIRGLLANGEIERANDLLGRPFTLEGTVVSGEGIGQKLGFPTANIRPAEKQIVPLQGVYAATVIIDGSRNTGVVNIGTRPTLGGGGTVVEVHIVDFAGNLYGRLLEIEFYHRLRDELCFPSMDALKEQIRADIDRALEMMKRTPAASSRTDI